MPLLDSLRLSAVLWIALGLAALWLLALLAPILSPFLLAALLAYIGNPLVDRLQALGLPRVLGTLLLLLGVGGLVAGLLLILLPLLFEEARILASRLPDALALIDAKLLPWLQERTGVHLRFDPETLKRLATDNADSLQAVARKLVESLKIGGGALLGIAINLVLVPVVMFYLLNDWPRLIERIERGVPRPWQANALRIARDIDGVLGQFLRGQVLVMLVLALYYSVALWLADLPSALSVGVLTGLLIFIPYLGYASGLILALLVAVLQFQGLPPVLAVLVIYGIGQLLESFLLTPYLVGERIGLHPLAVIFALMAFGQLFGFFGVLLALPASAALLVGLRELSGLYLASPFYRGGKADAP
jgi:predicted PurR-regulated permease PerM